jgi:hypothetical protein
MQALRFLDNLKPKTYHLGKKTKKLYMSLRKSKAKQSKNKTNRLYILLRKSQQRTNLLSATKKKGSQQRQ